MTIEPASYRGLCAFEKSLPIEITVGSRKYINKPTVTCFLASLAALRHKHLSDGAYPPFYISRASILTKFNCKRASELGGAMDLSAWIAAALAIQPAGVDVQ